jgi:hypothetical protein
MFGRHNILLNVLWRTYYRFIFSLRKLNMHCDTNWICWWLRILYVLTTESVHSKSSFAIAYFRGFGKVKESLVYFALFHWSRTRFQIEIGDLVWDRYFRWEPCSCYAHGTDWLSWRSVCMSKDVLGDEAYLLHERICNGERLPGPNLCRTW